MAYSNPDGFLAGIMAKARDALADSFDLVLVIIGAGATAALVEVLKSWFPEQTATIADETIAAAAGFLLFYFGDKIHRRVAPFGLGAFLAGVGAWSSQFTASIILMLKKAA